MGSSLNDNVNNDKNKKEYYEKIGKEANERNSYNYSRSVNLAISNDLIVGHSTIDPKEDYIQEEILGEGAFAKVFRVRNKYTDAVSAMKVIEKGEKYSDKEELEIINEIKILKTLDHPNILKIFEFYSGEDAYSIIMEYCEGGELYYEIESKKNITNIERYAAYIMYQILSGLNYLHNMNIIHRDLKPENILIADRTDEGYPRIKICDFGTSLIFKKGDKQKKCVGSVYYMAPEVIKRSYTEKCDIWSCGVILYSLIGKRLPFEGNNTNEVMRSIIKGEYSLKRRPFMEVSKNAVDLIQRLLVYDPKERISASQALEHPWFVENNSKELYNEITDKKIIRKILRNIKNYRRYSILQETALAYLVHNFPQMSDVVNACKLFNQIDINGDGKITKEEFLKGLKNKLRYTNIENDVDEIFNNVDMDNNGFIEYEEFVRAGVDKSFFISDDILKFAFKYFDKDNSGEITYDEIEEVFKAVMNKQSNVDESLKKIIKEVDINGDGRISFDEFAKIMKSMLVKKH